MIFGEPQADGFLHDAAVHDDCDARVLRFPVPFRTSDSLLDPDPGDPFPESLFDDDGDVFGFPEYDTKVRRVGKGFDARIACGAADFGKGRVDGVNGETVAGEVARHREAGAAEPVRNAYDRDRSASGEDAGEGVVGYGIGRVGHASEGSWEFLSG